MNNTNTSHWAWTILILIIFSAITIPKLNQDALHHDEVWSVYNSGGTPYPDKTLTKVWQQIATIEQDQAPGYPLFLTLWGHLAGWEELAARYSSYLIALLTIATAYTLTRHLHPTAAPIASALLATSAYFVYFAHDLRAFSLVILFSGLALLSYWRLLTTVRLHGYDAIAFIASLSGMLYAHYFALPLALSIGAYHLIFAPKNRRWLAICGFAVLAGICFLPALSILLDGVSRTADNARLQLLAMSPLELTTRTLQLAGNGSFIVGAILLTVSVTNARQQWGIRFITFIAVFTLALLVLMNANLRVIMPGRERYIAALWFPLMLTLGIGLNRLFNQVSYRYQPQLLLAAVLITGYTINTVGDVTKDIDGSNELPWREMNTTILKNATPNDTLVFHAPLYPWSTKRVFDHYKVQLPMRAEILESFADTNVMADYTANVQRVWVGVDERYPSEPELAAFYRVIDVDFIRCDWDRFHPETPLNLTLWARHTAYCPTEATIATTDGITLNTSQIETAAGQIHLYGLWSFSDAVLPSSHSASYRLIGENGEEIAQQDIGLPQEKASLINVTFDNLARGDYQIAVIVYNWSTGERRQWNTGGERLTLGHVTLSDETLRSQAE